MLDLHCHILPATDDGPQTLEESLQMARLAREDGITDIIATPHHHRFLRLYRSEILPRVASLNAELQRAGIAVLVWPGSEIQVSDLELYRADYDAGKLCHLGDRRDFSLWEWPWDERMHPEAEREHIGWLLERGTRPIVAHPERHAFFRDDLARLDALVEAGAWLQITAGSLLGHHGVDPQTGGEAMMRRYREVVLATDSHNLKRRSGLSEAYARVEELVGRERADEVKARAAAVLTGFSAPESV
ncbi:MAG: hypothetical protein KY445_15260 [Armatimonadetes bacterium]|nr:hypothetical protein [Armatimonadota bacterium]